MVDRGPTSSHWALSRSNELAAGGIESPSLPASSFAKASIKAIWPARSAIKALHAAEGSHYEAELKNGVYLPIGRSRYKWLRERLLNPSD